MVKQTQGLKDMSATFYIEMQKYVDARVREAIIDLLDDPDVSDIVGCLQDVASDARAEFEDMTHGDWN